MWDSLLVRTLLGLPCPPQSPGLMERQLLGCMAGWGPRPCVSEALLTPLV